MLDKFKSFWGAEIWQIEEEIRAKPGDIFLYHWPTGNLFSVRRMSAIWKSGVLAIQYFRALHGLVGKLQTFTESKPMYLENITLWCLGFVNLPQPKITLEESLN